MGLNVEIVREHIASICRGPAGLGASCLRSEGVRFEFSNNTVVTVTPDEGNLSKTSRNRQQAAIQRKKDAFYEDIDARYAARDRRKHGSRPGYRPNSDPGGVTIVGDPGPAGFAGFPGASIQPCADKHTFEVLPGGLSGGPAVDLERAHGVAEEGR